METSSPISELLARFGGKQALVVDDGGAEYLSLIARRFEQIQLLSVGASRFGSRRSGESLSNVTRSSWQGGELPAADQTYDAVFLFRVLGGHSEWSALLREALRVMKQRGQLILVEDSTVALSEQQAIQLDLERLMRDRDATLRTQPFTWLSAEELRRELRTLDLHHVRYLDFPADDFKADGAARMILKRDSLDRIKMDLLPSLGRLGARRDEFEKRLVELKRRIEVSGVAPLSALFVSGIKKTVYSNAETSLFASEVLAPEPVIFPSDIIAEAVSVVEQPPEPDVSELNGLTTAELLSLAMSGGESRTRMEKLAQRVLKEYGSRAVAEARDPRTLVDMLGISSARASQIVAIFELGRRFFASDTEAPVLRGPEDIYHYVEDMKKLRREQFRGLYLDTRQRLVADEVISIGTLTSAILHPREVYRPALTHRAVSVIVVHNHPSGDPEPSAEDIEMTRQLYKAGQIIGIELLDHVIVGNEKWFSLKSAGLF